MLVSSSNSPEQYGQMLYSDSSYTLSQYGHICIIFPPVKFTSKLYHKNNDTVYLYSYTAPLFFLRYAKQNIFLYTIISYTTFGLFNFSRADALKGELRSQASACFIRTPPNFVESLLMKINGPGGSRTRVQTRIPRSSTIIVSSFVFLRKPFPPNSGN